VAGRMDATAHRTLLWALRQPELVARYRSKIVTVPGSECSWWSSAVSGRGHGRFWLAEVDGRDIAVIAHRFGFALVHGAEALSATRVLGHRCDNPLCQRVAPGHVVASSASQNRREWAARRRLAGHPLGDPRGARGRSRALRDAIRASRELFEIVEAAGRSDGLQLPLWAPSGHDRAAAPESGTRGSLSPAGSAARS